MKESWSAIVCLIAKIRCSALAKHTGVGTKTEKRFSDPISTGVELVSPDEILEVEEGGPSKEILVRSSVPVSCPESGEDDCCVDLEIDVRECSDWRTSFVMLLQVLHL